MRLRYRRSRLRWICATAAPWALAGGLVISFTAAAGNDPQAGGTAVGQIARILVNSGGLVRSHEAASDDEAASSQALPRGEFKSETSGLPEVERSAKGDPPVSLHPSLSRRGSEVGRTAASAASRLVFGHDERLYPPTILMRGAARSRRTSKDRSSSPGRARSSRPRGRRAPSTSPAAAAAGSTGAATSATTPSVGRAVAPLLDDAGSGRRDPARDRRRAGLRPADAAPRHSPARRRDPLSSIAGSRAPALRRPHRPRQARPGEPLPRRGGLFRGPLREPRKDRRPSPRWC